MCVLLQTINHMAAQTVVLNQDRCTKNFYIYYEPASDQWSFIPWDLESSFSIDRGLGGGPNLADYCTLACEQWNSPLYCDRSHQQDLLVSTPWTLITTTINPTTLAAGGRKLRATGAASDPMAAASRSLKQTNLFQSNGGSNSSSSSSTNGAGSGNNPGLTSSDWSSLPANYDDDLTRRGPTPSGAQGTFNYLIDAILAVPRTRAMYMRRVRTLMDEFIASGRLEGLVTAEHELIKEEAVRDVRQWGNPGDPARGYRQLITEQLPIRRDQLYNTYGPDGETPLIPGTPFFLNSPYCHIYTL